MGVPQSHSMCDWGAERLCPDCLRAGISQRVKLRKRNHAWVCPECGGRQIGPHWFPAPVYPHSPEAWLAVMSARPAPQREIAYPNPAADVAERWERLQRIASA